MSATTIPILPSKDFDETPRAIVPPNVDLRSVADIDLHQAPMSSGSRRVAVAEL